MYIDLPEDEKWQIASYVFLKMFNEKDLSTGESVFGPTIPQILQNNFRLKIPKSIQDVDYEIIKPYFESKNYDKLLEFYKTAYWDKLGYKFLPSYLAVRVFNNSVFLGAFLSHKIVNITISRYTECLPWLVTDIFDDNTINMLKKLCLDYSIENIGLKVREETQEEVKYLLKFYDDFSEHKKSWTLRNSRI